jgi:hypothetical protein
MMPTVNDEHCSQCGYDLTGLSLTGRCPECGHAYDVFSGGGLRRAESGYQRGDRIAARLRTIAWGAAAACCLVCGGVLGLFVPNADTAMWLGVILAAVCALAAVTSFLYEKPEE